MFLVIKRKRRRRNNTNAEDLGKSGGGEMRGWGGGGGGVEWSARGQLIVGVCGVGGLLVVVMVERGHADPTQCLLVFIVLCSMSTSPSVNKSV